MAVDGGGWSLADGGHGWLAREGLDC
jgi:hypothetical protein